MNIRFSDDLLKRRNYVHDFGVDFSLFLIVHYFDISELVSKFGAVLKFFTLIPRSLKNVFFFVYVYESNYMILHNYLILQKISLKGETVTLQNLKM